MQPQPSALFSIKSTCNQIKRLMAATHPHCERALTGMQRAVIGYVGHSEKDVFQRDIERHFNIRRSTATGILQLMEKNGFVRREPVEHDMRLKRVVLTEQAALEHRRTKSELDALEAQITGNISQSELATFFKVMSLISENIETVLHEQAQEQHPEDYL